MRIPFSKISVGWREIWSIIKVLRSGWLTTGKVTKQFEKEFAEYVGAKYAVAVSSCTIGLELALKCKGIKRGDIVIVPAFTFCATAQAAENVGATVIFGDIKLDTLCLDENSIIVKRTKKIASGIIPVHLGGEEAFTRYDIPVIEDSAHRVERGQCKNNPNIVCFSFYPTKNMTTGEGGMVCTNDENEYKWLLKARSHGRTKLVGYGYDVEFLGQKANLPDVLSAIGLVQLRKIDKMNKKRDELVALYNEELGFGWHGNHLYPIFIKERERFIEYMRRNGVDCSVHFVPLHKMTAYKDYSQIKLPVTDAIGFNEVSLPLYPSLSKRQVKRICRLIKSYE
jgi:perosamine synthetase